MQSRAQHYLVAFLLITSITTGTHYAASSPVVTDEAVNWKEIEDAMSAAHRGGYGCLCALRSHLDNKPQWIKNMALHKAILRGWSFPVYLLITKLGASPTDKILGLSPLEITLILVEKSKTLPLEDTENRQTPSPPTPSKTQDAYKTIRAHLEKAIDERRKNSILATLDELTLPR